MSDLYPNASEGLVGNAPGTSTGVRRSDDKMVQTQIRRTSAVELGLVILIGTGIAGGATWATRITIGQDFNRSEFTRQVDELRQDVAELKELVRVAGEDRWRGREEIAYNRIANRVLQAWVSQTERVLGLEAGALPPLTLPDPVDILVHSE